MTALDVARDIRDAHRHEIVALPGVVGTGIGHNVRGDSCIRIYLLDSTNAEAYTRLIPRIEGVPVEWIVTGPIVAASEARA